MIASHRSPEPGHRLVLDALGLEPLLDLGLRLGEGSGAALAIPLVRSALAILERDGELRVGRRHRCGPLDARLAAAVAFLTRLPVGRLVVLDGADVARGAPAFPLVGAGVGAAGRRRRGRARARPPRARRRPRRARASARPSRAPCTSTRSPTRPTP